MTDLIPTPFGTRMKTGNGLQTKGAAFTKVRNARGYKKPRHVAGFTIL